MLIVSHHVKNKIKYLRVLRIILVVLPEHPSDTKVFTMKMEILLERTSLKLLVGDMWDPYGSSKWQLDSNDGKIQSESTLFQEIGLTNTFAKTVRCAHNSFLSFRAHWTCKNISKQKYFWWKIWFMLQNARRVSKTWFIRWHASDFNKSFLSSISECQFTDSLYRAVCFETFR